MILNSTSDAKGKLKVQISPLNHVGNLRCANRDEKTGCTRKNSQLVVFAFVQPYSTYGCQ
jgi:hypothetical protein